MEKKFIITFSNGFSNCEEKIEFIGTLEEAEEFAQDYLPDYAENVYFAYWWYFDFFYEDYNNYLADCGYFIGEEDE